MPPTVKPEPIVGEFDDKAVYDLCAMLEHEFYQGQDTAKAGRILVELRERFYHSCAN